MVLLYGALRAAALVAFILVVRSDAQQARPTLAEFFGWDDAQAMGEREVAIQDQVAQATAECMAGHGLPFEIPPRTTAAPVLELSPDQFAERYGFGITIKPPETAFTERDPNMEYLATLPAAEGETYRAVLFGDDSHPGCAQAAAEMVRRTFGSVFAELESPLASVRATIASDPRSLEAVNEWRSCATAAAGISIESQATVMNQVTELLGGSLPRTPTPGDLTRVRQRELGIAVAMRGCDRTLDVRLAPVIREHESKFIALHEPRLRAMRERFWEALSHH